jgi:hypothetical protein
MIDVNLILKQQNDSITNWHTQLLLTQESLPWSLVEENNQFNFLLWHEEDIARIKDIELNRIVEAKRNIDKYNQLRNNAIEKIDDWILSQLNSNTDIDLPMHSETPGMMIDRLSIMSLKKYHMLEETVRENASEEHRSNCSKKVSVLTEQIDDLSNCLKTILDKIVNGQLKFKVYRQFKMYNDPSLNPQLYKRTQS